MALKNAGGAFAETINTRDKVGQSIKGYYQGAKEVADHGVVHSIILEGEETEKNFWGCGSLNYRLKSIPKGCYVVIEYNGVKKDVPVTLPGKKKPVKKDVHDYNVQYDDEKKQPEKSSKKK